MAAAWATAAAGRAAGVEEGLDNGGDEMDRLEDRAGAHQAAPPASSASLPPTTSTVPRVGSGAAAAAVACAPPQPRRLSLVQIAGRVLLDGAVWAAIVGASAPAYALTASVLWLGTRAFPPAVFATLDALLYREYQELMRMFFEDIGSVDFVLHGDRPRRGERVLWISNHQCTVDWFVATVAAGGDAGGVRYILKSTLALIPLYGWCFALHGCIYTARRDSHVGLSSISSRVAELGKRPAPLWLVLFPEGTRLDPRKPELKRMSREFARRSSLALLDHVLTPRVKGFVSCVEGGREAFDTVLDVTICYGPEAKSVDSQMQQQQQKQQEKAPPSLADLVNGECPQVHVHMRRFPISDLPKTPEALEAWLYDRFEAKDRLLAAYSEQGAAALPGPVWRQEKSLLAKAVRVLGWTAATAFLLGTAPGRRLYVGTFVVHGLGGVLLMGVSMFPTLRHSLVD